MRALLAISLCDMYESWGVGVPTTDSDYSGPRICHLLLSILNIKPPHPILLQSNFRTRGQPTPDLPPHPSTSTFLPHSIIRLPRRYLSLSQHTKNALSRIGSSAHLSVAHLCWITLTPLHPLLLESISSSHLSPLPFLPNYRCYCSLADAKISSYMDPNMFVIRHLTPPRLLVPIPSLVAYLICAYFVNRP